jgi:hypothetical protein
MPGGDLFEAALLERKCSTNHNECNNIGNFEKVTGFEGTLEFIGWCSTVKSI